MSTETITLSEAEEQIGSALALIHRVLPRLDEPARAGEVQAALRKAAALLESAACASSCNGKDATPEIIAVIAAAISTVLTTSYRLVSVSKVTVPATPSSAWAMQGRSLIFQSHKIR
jgi:hypothetical protein